MTLNTDFFLSDNEEQRTTELITSFRDIASTVNGRFEQFTPTVYGSGTAGTPTYTAQTGWYFRQGLMVDVWFTVSWSAFGGGGAGNLRLQLPYTSFDSGSPFYVGTCSDENLTYQHVNHTHVVPIVNNNTIYAEFVSSGSGIARGWIPVQATGAIFGHIRYLGQSIQ